MFWLCSNIVNQLIFNLISMPRQAGSDFEEENLKEAMDSLSFSSAFLFSFFLFFCVTSDKH